MKDELDKKFSDTTSGPGKAAKSGTPLKDKLLDDCAPKLKTSEEIRTGKSAGKGKSK